MKNKASWYRQRKAILKTYEKAILEQYPKTPTGSGIYVLTRSENGKNKAYIGQSIHILQRMAEHMIDHKGHIDKSLKIYGLKTILNPKGWKLEAIECEKAKLDIVETNYIAYYEKNGYEVYNKTSGGQGEGKRKIAEYKEAKGYRQGTEIGYKRAVKDISELLARVEFTVKPKLTQKGTESVNSVKAVEKFKEILGVKDGKSL
jgi:hypothetical protein